MMQEKKLSQTGGARDGHMLELDSSLQHASRQLPEKTPLVSLK